MQCERKGLARCVGPPPHILLDLPPQLQRRERATRWEDSGLLDYPKESSRLADPKRQVWIPRVGNKLLSRCASEILWFAGSVQASVAFPNSEVAATWSLWVRRCCKKDLSCVALAFLGITAIR